MQSESNSFDLSLLYYYIARLFADKLISAFNILCINFNILFPIPKKFSQIRFITFIVKAFRVSTAILLDSTTV